MLFKKYLIIICIFMISKGIFSLNQSNISQTTDILWNKIAENLETHKIVSLHFDIKSAEYSDLLNFKLSKLATDKKYLVYETANDSTCDVLILLDFKNDNKRKNYYLFTRETMKQYPVYLIKIVKNDRVIYSDEIVFTKIVTKKNISNAKWYEPFMLSAVIGSLIYLIYYGNH